MIISTEAKIKQAIKLHQLKSHTQTIKDHMGWNSVQIREFSQMMREKVVRFIQDGQEIYIEIKEQKKMEIKDALKTYAISEDDYGGLGGEWKMVVFPFSDETVGSFKAKNL